MVRRVKVGVIGCGHISGTYLKNCTQRFDVLDVVACADLAPDLARKRAEEFHIPRACTVEELLADPEVEIVLNLTSPQAHVAVNVSALQAGKHVYTEKPFALTRADAEHVLKLARATGLRVGCAPDTFMGAGLQSCRKIIDAGGIGIPYAAGGLILMGKMVPGGRPNSERYLQLGWDPLFDMAPYYLTALVSLLGPVRRVSGSTGQLLREITMTDPASSRYGETIPIEAPMNVAATLDFENGAIATLQAAKESFGYTPRFEIYGTEGILYAPDPNFFGGPIRIHRPNGEIEEIPTAHSPTANFRGIGVADMAYSILSARPHRANGELVRHIMDITFAILESSQTERYIPITTRCQRPAPLPPGPEYNWLDT